MNKKYYIKTFGCQMNHSDSERIATVLGNNGLKAASNINEADFVIFNTCGVRQMAEDRVYGQVHNLAARNPKPVTIVTGCLAARKDVQRRLKNKVDLFCEIKDFPKKIKKLVIPSKVEGSTIKKLDSSTPPPSGGFAQDNRDYLKIIPKYKNGFQAYVPIMTGCNNFCSYCVVPYARGREISRPAEEIIMEVKNLVKKGYKEIVLLGQNVNSYKDHGSLSPSPLSWRRWRNAPDEGKTTNFSQLLKKVNAIAGHFWISFISNHPKDVTDEMIQAVAKLPKVCECFHLPVQSGNDEIIKKMNRKYTAKQYLNLIKKIKSAYKKYKPGKLFSITSDIIVGFPGETKKQFLDSSKVMKKAKFDMVYFGHYSPRPGTAAWKMKDSVSKKEKERREKYLNEILKKTTFENNKSYVGKIMEVLVSDKKSEYYFGHTRTMKNARFNSYKKILIGKFINVYITEANIWNLEGKAIK